MIFLFYRFPPPKARTFLYLPPRGNEQRGNLKVCHSERSVGISCVEVTAAPKPCRRGRCPHRPARTAPKVCHPERSEGSPALVFLRGTPSPMGRVAFAEQMTGEVPRCLQLVTPEILRLRLRMTNFLPFRIIRYCPPHPHSTGRCGHRPLRALFTFPRCSLLRTHTLSLWERWPAGPERVFHSPNKKRAPAFPRVLGCVA